MYKSPKSDLFPDIFRTKFRMFFLFPHVLYTTRQSYPFLFNQPTASYPMGTRGSFPGGKAARSWNWPLTSI
jgi:hypothetical protein